MSSPEDHIPEEDPVFKRIRHDLYREKRDYLPGRVKLRDLPEGEMTLVEAYATNKEPLLQMSAAALFIAGIEIIRTPNRGQTLGEAGMRLTAFTSPHVQATDIVYEGIIQEEQPTLRARPVRWIAIRPVNGDQNDAAIHTTIPEIGILRTGFFTYLPHEIGATLPEEGEVPTP